MSKSKNYTMSADNQYLDGWVNHPEHGEAMEYHIAVQDGAVAWVSIRETHADHFEIPQRWIQEHILDELEIPFTTAFTTDDDC